MTFHSSNSKIKPQKHVVAYEYFQIPLCSAVLSHHKWCGPTVMDLCTYARSAQSDVEKCAPVMIVLHAMIIFTSSPTLQIPRLINCAKVDGFFCCCSKNDHPEWKYAVQRVMVSIFSRHIPILVFHYSTSSSDRSLPLSYSMALQNKQCNL